MFPCHRSNKLRVLFVLIMTFVVLHFLIHSDKLTLPPNWYKRRSGSNSAYLYWIHDLVVMDYMNRRTEWSTSNLGTLLFKDQKMVSAEAYKAKSHYKILVWKVGPSLENRHIYNYGTKRLDPLEICSVRNCEFTYKDEDISTADAVLVHLHRNIVPNDTYRAKRHADQRWIFLTDESPEHTFLTRQPTAYTDYVDVFNWSMSYRTDSDIPVPYGRVVPLEHAIPPGELSDEGTISLIPNWKTKRKDVLVAILISNCTSKRMKFVRELSKYMTVHVYGGCSQEFRSACPGHFHADCPAINDYYFYLSFENAKCKEYITEKTYYNAYTKGAIPVIIGTDTKTASELLPPYSYIYADDYGNIQQVANAILNLGKDVKQLLSYHSWRHHFKILNEHGYFKTPSVHYCRICEAMNYNEVDHSVYDEKRLATFLDPTLNCVSY